jgi:hypothetical protein
VSGAGLQGGSQNRFNKLGDVGGDAPGLVAGRRCAAARSGTSWPAHREGVVTMFEMFGKLTVGLSSSLVMARNRSRSSISRS